MLRSPELQFLCLHIDPTERHTTIKRIYKVGRRYFDSAIHGDPIALQQLFEQRSHLWGDPCYEREICASELFADFSRKVESNRAFELMPIAVQFVAVQEATATVECGLWLIWQLARCSGTTELPKSLRDYLPLIRWKSSQCGDAAVKACLEILRHYRLQPTVFEFLAPWHPCTDPYFDDELRREVSPDHVLHGVEAKVMARRQDMDDFLFDLSDGRFANVHLTWSKEANSTWPCTVIYESRAFMEFEVHRQIDEWNESDND